MGLGSIVGTGIFVSVGTAAGSAGSWLVTAIGVASLVAGLNGLSSAQLAAAHPVSGGTYEYGYRWLHPSLGFTAGWMFLCAKSASAATAALGFAGYGLNVLGLTATEWRVPLALAAVILVTGFVLGGLRWSKAFNAAVVSVTLLSLAIFVAAGLPAALRPQTRELARFGSPPEFAPGGFLEACALMFVAYTGYGRIATLGEEVREPRRNIPAAIILTLMASLLLYAAVAWVSIATLGADALHRAAQQEAAPLEVVARRFDIPGIDLVIAIGAVTSMLGVLLNLVLGLSRVALAMGRRGDLPTCLAAIDRSGSTPFAAVIGVGLAIATLVLSGDVKTTWSFSAFTVLVYYALTNFAALQLREPDRQFPRVVAWMGLLSCLFLAFWVDRFVWILGLGIIAAGLVWQQFSKLLFAARKMEN